MTAETLAERPWWTYGDLVEGSGSPTDLCGSCGHARWLHTHIPCSAACGCECDGGHDYYVACFVPQLAGGVAPGQWDSIPENFPEFHLKQIKRDELGNIIWSISPR